MSDKQLAERMEFHRYNTLGFQILIFAFVFDLWVNMRTGSPDDTMVTVMVAVGLFVIIGAPLSMAVGRLVGDTNE